MMQTAVYLLTKASILGSYELTKAALMDSVNLIGIGAGLAKIDMSGFALAQLRKEVEELGRKVDVMLAAHSGAATQRLKSALIKLEFQDIAGAVKECYSASHTHLQHISKVGLKLFTQRRYWRYRLISGMHVLSLKASHILHRG